MRSSRTHSKLDDLRANRRRPWRLLPAPSRRSMLSGTIMAELAISATSAMTVQRVNSRHANVLISA